MDLAPFLLLDLLFVVGLTWWLWRRAHLGRPPKPVARTNPSPPETGSLPFERIVFEGNTAALTTLAVTELDRLALWLKSNTVVLELEGSADDTGPMTKNRQLARSRAAVAQRALLAHGIEAARLVVSSVEPKRGFSERERQSLRCVSLRVVKR